MLVGVAVYAVSVRVAWWVTGTDPSAGHDAYSLVGGYPALGDLPGLVRSGLRTVGRFWFGNTALFPVALKALGLGLIAAGTAAAALGRGPAGAGARGGRGGTRRCGWWRWPRPRRWCPFTVLFLRADPPADGSNFTTVGLVAGFWAGLLLEATRRRGDPAAAGRCRRRRGGGGGPRPGPWAALSR